MPASGNSRFRAYPARMSERQQLALILQMTSQEMTSVRPSGLKCSRIKIGRGLYEPCTRIKGIARFVRFFSGVIASCNCRKIRHYQTIPMAIIEETR
ncbi:hypothetical protein TKK_0014220 [Trichogramma kaykai]